MCSESSVNWANLEPRDKGPWKHANSVYRPSSIKVGTRFPAWAAEPLGFLGLHPAELVPLTEGPTLTSGNFFAQIGGR